MNFKFNIVLRMLPYLMGMYTCINCQPPNEFQSKRGYDLHKKRIHEAIRISCGHGCGKLFVPNSNNLRHHERTCDRNPNAARIGAGVPQQFFRQQQIDESQRMKKMRTAHGGNVCQYRKSIDSNQNIFDKLQHACTTVVVSFDANIPT